MTENQIINGVFYASLGTAAIPFTMMLFKGKKLKSKMYMWLGLYFLTLLILHGFMRSIYEGWELNWFIFNAGVVISFVFITLFYFHLLKTKSLKHIVLSKIPIALTVFVMEFLYLGDIDEYYVFTYITIHFFVTIYALYYFYEILNKNIEHDYLENSGAFWINAGTLLFYGGTFIVAVIYNILLRDVIDHTVYSCLIVSILSIVANLLFSLGLTTSKIRLT